jgi:hypothetical protein
MTTKIINFKNNVKPSKRFGVILLGLSAIFFGCLFILPFTSLPLPVKSAVGLLLLILMEFTFWSGTLIVGKQFLTRNWKALFTNRKN